MSIQWAELQSFRRSVPTIPKWPKLAVVWSLNTDNFTEQYVADTFDIVLLHGFDAPQNTAQLHAANLGVRNPNLVRLLYGFPARMDNSGASPWINEILTNTGSTDPTTWGLTGPAAEDWILHNPAGSILPANRVWRVETGSQSLQMNPSSAGFRTWIANRMVTFCQSIPGITGFFHDGPFMGSIVGSYGGWSTAPDAATRTNWMTLIQPYHAAIKSALHTAGIGTYIFNAGLYNSDLGTPDNGYVDDSPSDVNTDGCLMEAAFDYVDAPSIGAFSTWMTRHANATANGVHWWPEFFPDWATPIPDTLDRFTWALACFLLHADGQHGYLDYGSSAIPGSYNNVASYMATFPARGTPTESASTTPNGLWKRRFSGGGIQGVIVNPTAVSVTNDAGFGPTTLAAYTGYVGV